MYVYFLQFYISLGFKSMAMALNETRCILKIYTKVIPTNPLLTSAEHYKSTKCNCIEWKTWSFFHFPKGTDIALTEIQIQIQWFVVFAGKLILIYYCAYDWMRWATFLTVWLVKWIYSLHTWLQSHFTVSTFTWVGKLPVCSRSF